MPSSHDIWDAEDRRDHERAVYAARKQGISIGEYLAREEHLRKMLEGGKAWRKQKATEESISYFLDHRPMTED